MKSEEIHKLFKRTMSFVAKIYKIRLMPKDIPFPRAEAVHIIDRLIKENDKDKSRFANVKAYITDFEPKTGHITLKVVMINLRLNSMYFGDIGNWAYMNGRFVDQNSTYFYEWFDENNISKYYAYNIKRVYDFKTEWFLDESDVKSFEDNDYIMISEKLRKLVTDNKFWEKYHYVKIKNKRYFDIYLRNFMYTFNINISNQLYKYMWKTYENLNREFPIDFYRKKMSGEEIKRLAYSADIELSKGRKDDEVVKFEKSLTLSGLFNINCATWSIINIRVKYYEKEDDFNKVKHNNHYTTYQNKSVDIIDRYIWLSEIPNFTGYDSILLKGE